MHRIQGIVKHYDWGDPAFLPQLLRESPDGTPWAEVWFGTHRDGCATIDNSSTSLQTVVGDLPYMMKFLSAASPLSLQVHPSLEQAREGFARENAAGIDLDDSERIYRDAFDKPELLIALTSFMALCGFHDVANSVGWFRAMSWDALANYLEAHGIGGFAAEALCGTQLQVPEHLPPWANQLRLTYPDDPAVLVALLMHHVELAPGDCFLLEAGTLHAYLRGNAVEVMSGSDNVIRAGFTKKYTSREELIRIASFEPCATPVRQPEVLSSTHATYPGTGSFSVRQVCAPGEISPSSQAQMVLFIEGSSPEFERGDALLLEPGESLQLANNLCAVVATTDTRR